MTAFAAHVNVTDFGARPNSREDATKAIAKAIEAAGSNGTIEFAPGQYHFYRENAFERELFLSNSDVVNPRRISILIEKKTGLKLLGNGAQLIFHDRVMPIAILGSRKVSVDGLTIDWERPLMSQATVRAADKSGMTLSIDKKEYPYVVEAGKLFFTDTTWKREPWSMMEFDPATKGVAYKTGDEGFTDADWRHDQVSELEPGLIRYDFRISYHRWPKIGDILVIRHGVRDHAGSFVQDSKDVSFTNVKYRHTSGLGVLCQYSENLSFKRVDVAPDPKSGRLFAGHDDGFHFSNCKGHIEVDSCEFQGLMDDPINVHGSCVPIKQILSDRKVLCHFGHDQSIGLRFGDPGDEISFVDEQSLLSIGKAKIASIKHLSAEEFEVEFDRPMSKWVAERDSLENLTWTPSFTVRNSTFGRVRARGLLVSTPGKVLIENNLFQSSGAAILICGDANGWYESGAVTDVTIRKNTFEDCNSSAYQFGNAVIAITPQINNAAGPYHRNIRIEKNTFKAFDPPILYAYSVSNLVFRDNVIQQSHTFPALRVNDAGLTLQGCDHVRVEHNTFDPDFLGKGAQVSGGKPETNVIEWPKR